jgi:hypothetical protein
MISKGYLIAAFAIVAVSFVLSNWEGTMTFPGGAADGTASASAETTSPVAETGATITVNDVVVGRTSTYIGATEAGGSGLTT